MKPNTGYKTEDSIYKFFILSTKSNAVFGVITETKDAVYYDCLGNKGDGKFYAMHRDFMAKKHLENVNLIPTYDYQEAYNHLTKDFYDKQNRR